MSRRPPNPAAEKQARNQVTLKSLLKLEPNKMCADCKRNKHPRWASWNLGVFICIRCSGIHRSMGVHISRVKSVDLDSWTDEQMQSILSWGNARANKYWEDKLAPGHTPSEAKIENFIRTKYELKRWVMDGPMPDPASLDADGDDDVPLSLVKEKQTIERKESLRRSGGQSASPTPQPQAATFDLIGGDDPIPRASTAGPVATNVPPKAAPAPPKATPANSSSLLGLDFLGSEPAPPSRPASTTGFGGATGGTSRPDLKQSILSLYATAPRPQQAQQPSHSHSNSFGSMHSPTAPAAPQQQQQQQSSLNDAFSNLSFANISNKSPPTSSPSTFSSFGGLSSNKSPPPQTSSAFSGLSGGSFFDAKPAAPSPKPAQSSFGGFGDFSAPAKPAAAPASSSAMNDLFDFSATSSSPAPAPAATTTTTASSSSVFNLSQPKPSPAPAASTTTPSIPLASLGGGSDVWGGNAWADPAPAAKAPTPQPAVQASSSDFGGWGSMGGGSFANTSIVPGASGGMVTQPKVSADEEFGGWTSSTGAATTGTGGGKGVGGSEDLFSNVWE